MRFRWLIPSASRLLIVAAILLLALLCYPVRNQITRTGILLAAAGTDCALLITLRKRRKWLLTAAVPQALAAIFLLLPGRASDPPSLRHAYLAALLRFEGTRYVWGGENHLGVDCSGLLRAALVEAHLAEGLRTANPALLRQAFWYWWNDASARELSDGYRAHTRRTGTPALLVDASTQLKPADFAVTADGSHILAYLGDGKWIEADPYVNRVIRFSPGEDSQWWNTKVVPGEWIALW